ncbi:MAG TPA: paraquat-inducible protein A [Steroidobacteraceae bacterium]|nr:paraquat-inducible protein A [Steroidobacteraceae bacterium]
MTIACSHCGTLQELPPLPRGAEAACPVCDHRLERTSGRSLDAALTCSLATWLLLFPANLLPLMSVSMLGATRETRAGSGVVTLWQGQRVIVAVLVAAFVLVLPILRFGFLSAVLASLRLGRRPAWLGRAFRYAMALDFWAMPDVFLIGCAVGYSRVAANLTVKLGSGGICLVFAAVFAMLSRATLDRRTTWRSISQDPQAVAPDEPSISCTVCDLAYPEHAEGSACTRCGARLKARKTDSQVRTAALLIAGFVLYIPANYFPMSTDVQLGTTVPHRIIDGIEDLVTAGLWPLGVLIFCTSIAIPLLKLLGLGWLWLSVRLRSKRHRLFRTRLYRAIDEIGRWSNIDIFTIAVFVPLLQFGTLATARAATGATAFLLVVVLTMIASQVFDPRLIWDEPQPERA